MCAVESAHVSLLPTIIISPVLSIVLTNAILNLADTIANLVPTNSEKQSTDYSLMDNREGVIIE